MKLLSSVILGIVCVLKLASCNDTNTLFTDDFDIVKFNSLEVGSSNKELMSVLGEPFQIFTHVDFGSNRGSNNVLGAIHPNNYPDAEYVRHVLIYSKSRRPSRNHWVYAVQVDPHNGEVIGKYYYLRD